MPIYNAPNNPQSVVSKTGNILVDPYIPDAVTPLDVDLLRYKPILPPLDYTNLDFSSIKLQLLNLLKANAAKLGYSVRDFADSNTAGMLMNLQAYMGQLLSYHTDSMVNELFLDTSQSPYAAFRLLNMFKYKPTRPNQGVLMLKVVRTRSTAQTDAERSLEDSSELLISSNVDRRRLSFGSEVFEIFPIKTSLDGIFEPDYLGDFKIPAYVSVDDPDASSIEPDLNTYTCFALSGTTVVEDFISNGLASQMISLSSAPVLNSNIIVQVQEPNPNTSSNTYYYNTWTELAYLALSGYKKLSTLGASSNLATPYLIAPYKLSDDLKVKKTNGLLVPGTLVAINYDRVVISANYTDFLTLSVPYRVGIIASLDSNIVSKTDYIDLVMYHPSYIYSDTDNTNSVNKLINTVKDSLGNDINWSIGDILYVLGYKSNGVYSEPQMISDTQIQLADTSKYPGIKFLKENPDYRMAVGRVVDNNIIAFGLSADIDTYYEPDEVYEVSWDGDFVATVRFGDGNFGKVPAAGLAIKIMYRTNESNSFGYIVRPGEANRGITIGNTSVQIYNELSSAPSTAGESIDDAKELVTRFYASQDRAVSAGDYITLAKKYNTAYKVSTALVKADSDGSIVRLYCLSSSDRYSVRTLTTTEKYELRNYLNNYKCIGVDVEVADGLTRALDIRVDARIKAGYLSGQIRGDITTIIGDFFKLSNFEMGHGLNTGELIKALSSVSGVRSFDVYFGGYATAYSSDGLEVASGIKTYKNIKDIPGYEESQTNFPKVTSDYEVIFGVEDHLQSYELIVLSNLEINIA